MDRDQQRQNRRNAVAAFSCTSGAELTPLQSPTGRPAVDCDPIPAAPVPFTPVVPPVCPPPLPIPLNLPPGLTVSNDPTTAYCPSTGGYSVTGTTASSVTAGAQQQVVLFTALENITENQLNYLYEVVPTSSTAIINASLSGATNTVISLTHLNYAQAEELIITIQDAKFTVNTLAVEQARNLLICQVESNLQAAVCPTSAYFGPSAAVPTNLPYVPSATSATGAVLVTFALLPSTGGQTAFTLLNIPSLTAAAAQANSIALSQAESSLRCVFGNAATAAACCATAAPNNNLGFTYCVPATGPTIEGSATAVGYFAVDTNTVFSSVSLAEANSVARELSRNSLNCYFPSTGLTATCTSLGLTGPFAPLSTTSAYLPPGSVILYDLDSSVTAANEQALIIAEASLNCFWSNSATTAYCPPSPGFTAINNQYYILDASDTLSINYSSTVDADTVISYSSQSDANSQAFQLASASVSCLYCNDVIPPTCSGGINATVGTEANLVCNVLAEVAQNTAISIGNILVSTSNNGDNCCYGNAGVTNTNKCGPSALFNSSADSTFTSADVFYIPADVITLCASIPRPPPPELFFAYNNLVSTDNIIFGCCSDISACSGTGAITSLPTLYSRETNLFSGIASGATFYTSNEGLTAYAFPATASYVVSRATRAYRSITGGTGYTEGFNACNSCTGGLSVYSFRGASAAKYISNDAINADIFCGGPTAQPLTLYTTSSNPFGATASFPIAWFLDGCGESAFNPVTISGGGNNFVAGYVSGSTGYLINFATLGSNLTFAPTTYNIASCPLSKYEYSVFLNSESCSTASGTATLYGTLPAPQLFTSSTASTRFTTQILNDAAIYSAPAGVDYINYAYNGIVYYRPITGSTAAPPITCLPPVPLYPVTVQWSSATASDVCNFPNYFGSTANGIFNENIASIWSSLENPFTVSTTAVFYKSNASNPSNIFQPGGSSIYYLSKFTPGDTYRNAYREYTSSDYVSTLKSYTAAFNASPFRTETLWAHSATANYMNTEYPAVPNTKLALTVSVTGQCAPVPIYSDIKLAVPLNSALLNNSFKTLPIKPISGDIYSNSLLFDGIGYKLSSTAQGSSGASIITLNDLSKVGAGFTGAIIRCANVNRIGSYQIPAEGTAIPTYINSIDTNAGVITLGGYYNQVNTTFSNEPLYVTGFKVEASIWSGSQFTCYGENCSKIEVGHSLFSYYIGAEGLTASVGYVFRVSGNTISYIGAPGYNNFAAFNIGTGASHGSGHVYIQGRQFARLWTDNNKTQPLQYDLQANTNNFVWSQTGGGVANQTVNYTVAKNLIVGNTAGSTAEFIVAGVNYQSAIPPQRPLSLVGGLTYAASPGYFYDTDVYECNGGISKSRTPVYYESHGYVNTCCDMLTPTTPPGATQKSACEYSSQYGSTPINSNSFAGFVDYIPSINTWFDSSSHSVISSGAYVVEGRGGATNDFARVYFNNGLQQGTYPCNANSTLYTAGQAWMREYLGFWDAGDPYTIPIDDSAPGGATAVNDPYYWRFGPNSSLQAGFIFKEYIPDIYASPGCNVGNFIPTEYGVTSGYRYSIWATTDEAWSNVQQLGQIQYNVPAMAFNSSTAACGSFSLFSVAGNAAYDSIDVSDTSAISSNVIEFNPANYDVPSSFNFSAMPSVGGTAEDLKLEATNLAQTIVNSFVRCFYLNDGLTGKGCPAGQYVVNTGFISAGEYVSNLSKLDANNRAQDIADSRTICLSPDIIGGGAGCDQTKIKPVSATAGSLQDKIFAVNLNFENKQGCVFTPEMTATTSLFLQDIEFTEMKICSVTGASRTLQVVTLKDYTPSQQVQIALKNKDD